MRKLFMLFLLILFVVGCASENKNKVDVSKINIQITVDRFDIDFYSATKNTLSTVKKKYPLLFPANTPDSIWMAKINDKDERELFAETKKIFPTFTEEKKQLTSLFKHIKYYHVAFKPPHVITMLTNLDYENRVVYADSLLLISLDAYLGKLHPFYKEYPTYIRENNHKNHFIVDVANAIIKKNTLPNKDRTFISKMIFEGKKLYLLDVYLPELSDKEKIGYIQKKLDWATANEEEIWKYFIEKKLLYATDSKLSKRFIDVAPFSKFYLAHDNLSPGGIGRWIGWQIVRSYMKENDVSLQQLMQTDASIIFKESKYKPKR